MNEQMEFPETFEKFAKEYGFKDDKEVYTNGSELIPVFRVKQWIERDYKLRTIETDTAYECGKHANKWILVSERLPEVGMSVLGITVFDDIYVTDLYDICGNKKWYANGCYDVPIVAWMPLPQPYKESEDK